MKILFLLFLSAHSYASFQQSVGKQELLTHGKDVYMMRCSGCHGAKGDGKGPAYLFLDPKPRDFTTGVFKFKSTELEALPTDEDLMKTLSQGLLGTSMPSFRLMPEMSRMAVVEYIKTFSSAFKTQKQGFPTVGAPFPVKDFSNHKNFINRAKKGRSVYIEACVTCHGITGKGDGEGAEGLEDDWENPVVPADLTKPFIKSGKSVRNIYQTLLSGVGGTPMPSFKGEYSDKKLWDVAAYVLYLRGKAAGQYGAKDWIQPITVKEIE